MENPYHIINEYGILKNILSYLTSKELLVAAKVNSNWKRVAHIILHEHSEFITYIKGTSWPKLNAKIYPKVIIYNNDTDKTDLIKLTRKEFPDVKKCLKNSYDHEDYYFIYLSNWKFINTLKMGKSLDIFHSSDEIESGEKCKNKVSFKESLLIIPEFCGLKVDCEFINHEVVQHDCTSIINKVRDSKCCLFFTSMMLSMAKTNKIIKNICDSAYENGRDIVMAGGIAQYIMKHDNLDSRYIVSGGTVLTFHGDNLSSKSFVISFRDDLTSSFTKMANEVGPLETGYKRVGFIFTCVERYNVHLEEETKEFSKFFPDVQLHGFWSYGEFCLGYSNSINKKCRTGSLTSKGQQFYFQRSSTYLIITFKDL